MTDQQASRDILAELLRARPTHRPMHGPHEAYGVLNEEMHDLLHAITANDLPAAIAEARQIAAMAIRFVVDLTPDPGGDPCTPPDADPAAPGTPQPTPAPQPPAADATAPASPTSRPSRP